MKATEKMNRGFTLIELLIVVAIIAILAAIAIPNFLEAQTRSKVARCKADMRSIAVALQAYRVDNEMYPPDWDSGRYGAPPAGSWGDEAVSYKHLTTPVAYMTSIPLDAFYMNQSGSPPGMAVKNRKFFEYSEESLRGTGTTAPDASIYGRMTATNNGFLVISCGPDRFADFTWRPEDWEVAGYNYSTNPTLTNSRGKALGYDPTNGTISDGDIICHAKGFYPR